MVRALRASGGEPPPLRSYWCTYSRAWIDAKHAYQLNVTATERIALHEILDTCDAG
ncbi:hypothetical protein ACIRQY_02005 [Streptomyces sp. NPDC101490]|uniref:hypothetical protein n=1 Tax=Streptomyces sp. NPDC101490 TaxID=3366143 RepID=UPI003820CA62